MRTPAIILISILFSSFFFKSKAQVNLTQGLVAHYPFDGNANDASGNGYHGQTMNGIQLGADRFGAPNSAYVFDGIDDYIRVTDNGAFSTAQFSLVLWFQSQSDALQNLVGKRHFTNSSGSGGSQYQFFINYPPFPGIGSNIVGNNSTCNDAINSSYINTADVICSVKWYLAVVTYDGSRHKIYIDGVLVRDLPTTFNAFLSCNSELRFGNWWTLDLIPFKGRMDDIRWYNRPLNQQEVDALFDNFVSPTSPAEFTFSQDACNPARINFTSNSTNAQITSWNFGDGNGSLSTNPTHTYANYGTYLVKLSVTTGSGCIDSIARPITIDLNFQDVITTNDTSICLGQSVQLNTIAGSDFCWQNSQYLNSTNITNPVATPTQTITYYFNAKVTGNNLVNNGSFTGGNSGFSSEYLFTSTNNTEGQYNVGSNPVSWNTSFSACGDHTTGTGNMLMVNGTPQANMKVWCQSLVVTPNTNYEFSAWVQSLFAQNPAQLKFSINGVQVGNIFNAGAVCTWLRYGSSWNSGTNTVATICIENKNTVVQGNDFAIDDISLAPVFMRRDSITITVIPMPTIQTIADTTICQGGTVQLNATGGSVYSWSPAAGLSNTNIANPVATPTATTQYIVTGYNDPACKKSDSITITVNPLPVFAISPPQTSKCEDDQVVITASGADTYQWFTQSQSNISTGPQLQINATTSEVYYVALDHIGCKIKDTLSSTVTVNPNPVVTVTSSNDIDCSLAQSQLTATGGTDYIWSPSTNINDPTISNPIVFPDVDTWYKVVVTDAQGCSTIDSVLVKSDLSKGEGNFVVPSGFTPNRDGKNDCFGVRYWGTATEFEFWVFNRWGQVVFYTKDRQKCWDGTIKGIDQPGGVFVYQIKAKSPCSPVPIYRKGTFVLIR